MVVAAVTLMSCSARDRDVAHLEVTGSAIDAEYNSGFDAVWDAVESALAREQFPAGGSDRTAGRIDTGYAVAGPDVDELACSNLDAEPGARVDAVRYRLHILVSARAARRATVRVYADVQGHSEEGRWIDCTSTGEVERMFLDSVQSRLADR